MVFADQKQILEALQSIEADCARIREFVESKWTPNEWELGGRRCLSD